MSSPAHLTEAAVERKGSAVEEPVAFLMCVERGRLESQAVLLARSIRRNAGRFADAPIYAFSPRPHNVPSRRTEEELRALGVTHVTDAHNTAHDDYGMANKFVAGTWAEIHAHAMFLAFVDSDTIFTAEPSAFVLADGIDVAVTPADRKDKGSTGPGDEREPYWERLYELTGVAQRPWVKTRADGQCIRGYYNGGLVVARSSTRFFSTWLADFETLFRAGHLPPEGLGFMDMLSLAATVARIQDRMTLLEWRYNYPLPLRGLMPSGRNSVELDGLVHVHYHRWFNRPRFLDLIRPPLSASSPMRRWVEPFLPLQPIVRGLPAPLLASGRGSRARRLVRRTLASMRHSLVGHRREVVDK